jgi:hypothetical protein
MKGDNIKDVKLSVNFEAGKIGTTKLYQLFHKNG